MEKQRLIPDKARILSGSVLKLIAVATMLIDHIAAFLVDKSTVLFSVGGFSLSLYTVMRNVGRIAFPLFCFLVVEGFLHTRSRVRYGVSLLIAALISEIPWNLVHGGKVFYPTQNVFFTLLFGYLGICAIAYLKKHPFFMVAALIALPALCTVLRTDFNYYGCAFIILLYALREHEAVRPLTALLLNSHWWAMVAFVPISLYNGKRGFIKGPVLKYAFYLFYPVHLLVIWLIKDHVFF